MSLVQIGSESVWIELYGQKYFIRELYVPEYAINITSIETNYFVNAWRTYCLTKKRIQIREIYTDTYQLDLKIQESCFRIISYISKTSQGLETDIRLTAELIVQI